MIEAASGNLAIDGTPGLLNYSSATKTLTGGTYIVSATLQFTNADVVTNAATIVLDGPAAEVQDAKSAATRDERRGGLATVRGGKTRPHPARRTRPRDGREREYRPVGGDEHRHRQDRGTGTVAATHSNGTVEPGAPGTTTAPYPPRAHRNETAATPGTGRPRRHRGRAPAARRATGGAGTRRHGRPRDGHERTGRTQAAEQRANTTR